MAVATATTTNGSRKRHQVDPETELTRHIEEECSSNQMASSAGPLQPTVIFHSHLPWSWRTKPPWLRRLFFFFTDSKRTNYTNRRDYGSFLFFVDRK